MKVLAVIGTRPEAIKLAPVIHQFRSRASDGDLNVVVCTTSQHREMLSQVFSVFGIDPEYDLNVMEDNQSLSQIASAVLQRLERVLQIERPDWVLVEGDTCTVSAAALAAYYSGAQVGHVEAGLRTHDRRNPYPEEVNRRVAGAIADLHFAPTDQARQNLLREGVSPEEVIVTGNPVIDALLWAVEQPLTPALHKLIDRLTGADGERPVSTSADLPSSDLSSGTRLVLVTAHRRENFGLPLENICLALSDLASSYGGRLHIVYPVHMNPNISGPVHRLLSGSRNVTLLEPVDYITLVHLMKAAYFVMTDSGGIQEEAPALGKPVLVLRDATERPEAVESGTARIVGTERRSIFSAASRLLDDAAEYEKMAQTTSPYGDGYASQRIVAALLGEPVDQFEPGIGGGPDSPE